MFNLFNADYLKRSTYKKNELSNIFYNIVYICVNKNLMCSCHTKLTLEQILGEGCEDGE